MTFALAATLLATMPTIKQDTNAKSLDFWLGKWKADSHQPQPDGTIQESKDAAKNHITKIKGDKVIHEDFTMPGFNGESWSVFDPKANKWHQTWVDDAGAYLTLVGGMEGDEFVLTQTHPNTIQRMRFTKITKDSFVWLWESKKDDTWTLAWQLDYHREK
ncbi:MAG: hypothetical protein ACKVQS_09135 [Fimbriimonadaceae bacterium]